MRKLILLALAVAALAFGACGGGDEVVEDGEPPSETSNAPALSAPALPPASAAACTTALAGAETPLVIVASPRPGAAVSGAFTTTGCSRTFEANVNWRLLALDGSELASGFATGGGVDGAEPFEFAVAFSVDEEQRGLLEVFEVDASGGEGFPPPSHSVPLLLLP